MERIVSLCKRRGFIFANLEIYGGIASTWDYGPLGVELKNNVMRAWWRSVVYERDDMEGLDAAILMNRLVWRYSGHEATFSDPMIDCRECKSRHRADPRRWRRNDQGAVRSAADAVAAVPAAPAGAADRARRAARARPNARSLAMGRHQQDRDGPLLINLVCRVDAIQLGHLDIGNDQVRLQSAQQVQVQLVAAQPGLDHSSRTIGCMPPF